MNELKFELSVLFTKNKDIHCLIGNDIIKEEYQEMFRKEVKDEELARMIQEIIDDQLCHQEIPEDFELL